MNIQLEFQPQQVILRIQDNGRGFIPQEAVGPNEGHFGLLGISERVKRLGGQFDIVSAPEQGTIVQIEIPLSPIQETVPTTLVGL